MRSSSLTASKFGESASSTFVVTSKARDRFLSDVTGDVLVTLLRVERDAVKAVSNFFAEHFLLLGVCCSSDSICLVAVAAAVDDFCLVGVAVAVDDFSTDAVAVATVDDFCLVGVGGLTFAVSTFALLLFGSADASDDTFELEFTFCLNL